MKPIKLTDDQMDAALGLGSGQVDNIQHVTGYSDAELAAVYSVPIDVVRAIRRMGHEHCKTGRCGAHAPDDCPHGGCTDCRQDRNLTHVEKTLLGALK